MQTTKRHGRATASVQESDGESEGGSGMNSDTRAYLDRLGVHANVVRRLNGYAEDAGMSLRELVLYILTDYAPARDGLSDDS